jgi:GNAT superfamily N-acetyltransferase
VQEAEARLAAPGRDGRPRLSVWASAHDPALQALLAGRGYVKGEWPEYQRRRPIDGPIESVPAAEGYSVRALGNEDELPRRSWASWRAFHPNEPDEKYEGWTWYRNVQRAPLYRRDLDLVAVAETGELAAFCTVWFDDVTRSAVFEPVGTVPEHQRRGLGRALMTEGLRRAQRVGATLALVASFSAPAHALYEAMGFREYELLERWGKTLA